MLEQLKKKVTTKRRRPPADELDETDDKPPRLVVTYSPQPVSSPLTYTLSDVEECKFPVVFSVSAETDLGRLRCCTQPAADRVSLSHELYILPRCNQWGGPWLLRFSDDAVVGHYGLDGHLSIIGLECQRISLPAIERTAPKQLKEDIVCPLGLVPGLVERTDRYVALSRDPEVCVGSLSPQSVIRFFDCDQPIISQVSSSCEFISSSLPHWTSRAGGVECQGATLTFPLFNETTSKTGYCFLESRRSGSGGPWLRDRSGEVVGFYSRDGCLCVHPSVPANLPEATRRLLFPRELSLTPATPDLLCLSTIRPQRIIGHYEPGGLLILHPVAAGRVISSGASPGTHVTDQHWVIDSIGQVVGHRPLNRRTSVMHPTRKFAPAVNLSGLRLIAAEPTWVVDGRGRVVGHVDNRHHLHIHPRSPSSLPLCPLPGCIYIPMDSGCMWLVGSEGDIRGYRDAKGVRVEYPDKVKRDLESFGQRKLPFLMFQRPFLLNSKGKVAGHYSEDGRLQIAAMFPLLPGGPGCLEGLEESDIHRGFREFHDLLIEERTGRVAGEGDSLFGPFKTKHSTEIPGLYVSDTFVLDCNNTVVGRIDKEGVGYLYPQFQPLDNKTVAQSMVVEAVDGKLIDRGLVTLPVFDVSELRPSGLSGLWWAPGMQWLTGADGKASARVHPFMAVFPDPYTGPPRGSSPLPETALAAKDTRAAWGSGWIVSQSGWTIGQTDGFGKPLLFPSFTGHSAVSVDDMDLIEVAADPFAPHLGGPWILDDRRRPLGWVLSTGKVQWFPRFPSTQVCVTPLAAPRLGSDWSVVPKIESGDWWIVGVKGQPVGEVAEGALRLFPVMRPRRDSPAGPWKQTFVIEDDGIRWVVDKNGLILGRIGLNGRTTAIERVGPCDSDLKPWKQVHISPSYLRRPTKQSTWTDQRWPPGGGINRPYVHTLAVTSKGDSIHTLWIVEPNGEIVGDVNPGTNRCQLYPTWDEGSLTTEVSVFLRDEPQGGKFVVSRRDGGKVIGLIGDDGRFELIRLNFRPPRPTDLRPWRWVQSPVAPPTHSRSTSVLPSRSPTMTKLTRKISAPVYAAEQMSFSRSRGFLDPVKELSSGSTTNGSLISPWKLRSTPSTTPRCVLKCASFEAS